MRVGTAGGPDRDVEAGDRSLGDRGVELGLRAHAELGVADVAHDSDDLALDPGRARARPEPDVLSDGVARGPESPGRGLAREDRVRGAVPVLGTEEPPGDERNPERSEVVVARHAQLRRGLVGAFGGAPDAHAAAEGKARQREPEDRRGRLRSGQSAHARQELPRELALAGFVRITGLGKGEVEREDLLGAEPRIDGREAREALDEETRADEEDERDRDLPGHEHPAQTHGAARRGGVAAPAPERPHRPGLEGAERGRESEHQGRRQGPDRGEGEHARRRSAPRTAAGTFAGARRTITSSDTAASARPAAAPAAARTRLSVRSCRASRARLAPRAVRTAISELRRVARIRSRFATFAHAISVTSPTAPSSISSAGRTSPTRVSASGRTTAVEPPFVRG